MSVYMLFTVYLDIYQIEMKYKYCNYLLYWDPITQTSWWEVTRPKSVSKCQVQVRWFRLNYFICLFLLL